MQIPVELEESAIIDGASPLGVLVRIVFPLSLPTFATIGLFALSQARGPVGTLVAATIFAAGVCYFWPTMLAFTSERLPRTGALGLAIMGGAGMLSVAFVLPVIGRIFDHEILRALPVGADVLALKNAVAGSADGVTFAAATAAAGQATLRWVAALPVVLILAFGALWMVDRRRGGYRRESLSE